MKRPPLPVAVLAASSLWAVAVAGAPEGRGEPPGSPPLTLAQAVARFRRDGYDLIVADADVEAAEGDAIVAGAVPNPSATVGYLHSFFAPGQFETHDGWLAGLGDANAVADALSGKRGLRRQVGRSALVAARMHGQDLRRTLELQVKTQFVAVASAAAALQVAREVEKTAARTFDLNQIRYQRGAISEVELARTETAGLEAQQATGAADQALAQAKVLLSFLVGERPPSIHFEVDPAEIRFRVPAALSGASLASLLDSARAGRPDLMGQAAQNQRAAAAVALARRQRFPDLGLSVQYQQQGPATSPTGAQPVSPPTLQLALTGTLPIFYRQQGEVRRAEADLSAQRALLAKTEAQIAADVEGAWAGYQTSRALVTRMEGRLLDRARRARDLTVLQYEKGATSLLDYLDAQRTFITVNAEYLQDLANYWNAVFQLEAAVATELVQ